MPLNVLNGEAITPFPLMSPFCSLECRQDRAEQSYWTEKSKLHIENDGVEIPTASGLLIKIEHYAILVYFS